MKKRILITLLIISSCLFLIACKKDIPLKADTPVNLGVLAKFAMSSNDYEALDKLFSEDRKRSISKADFKELNSINTSASDYKLYNLMTFENGEMALIKISSENIDGEYKIEDIKIIPDEMKYLFEE